MFGLIGWMIFGLLVGAVAKFLMPGRDPGGLILTMLIGLAGAGIGGWIGRSFGMYGSGEPAGFVMALVGAVSLLLIYRMVARRRDA